MKYVLRRDMNSNSDAANLTEAFGSKVDSDTDVSPWEEHIAYMTEVFGRRDPECRHCGERVWMALQNFFSGGFWTTNQNGEGPASSDLETGTRCPQSPDGRHDVERL